MIGITLQFYMMSLPAQRPTAGSDIIESLEFNSVFIGRANNNWVLLEFKLQTVGIFLKNAISLNFEP